MDGVLEADDDVDVPSKPDAHAGIRSNVPWKRGIEVGMYAPPVRSPAGPPDLALSPASSG
jgi:hypothetical protein